MDCCQCQGLEEVTKNWAGEDLRRYRRGKTVKTTQMLVRSLQSRGVQGRTLLDIGGGIGAVQLELLAAGATQATSVEASAAYIDVARQEAARAAVEDRITYVHGDFVSLAESVPPADIVTLDRVICCYHDVNSLVSLSAAKAGWLYAVVYPRATWWTRLTVFFENLGHRFRGSSFRAFIHSAQLVERLVRDSGLERIHHEETFAWQVVLYQRP